jgi:vitamin B12 transporter
MSAFTGRRRHASLSLIPFAVLAAGTTAAGEPLDPLQVVVVTATRVPEPLGAALSSVTVIDRADIERRQAQGVEDLLRGVAGVSVANNGGIGKPSTVFLRGAESDQTLVLIDGVRVGSTTAGLASFQDMPLEQVERIEIVRGPRSGIYGSEALGGVVQLFTRHGVAGEMRPEFVAGSGSAATQRLGAGFSGGGDRFDWRVGVSALQSDGTNACEGYGAPRYVGCFTDEPDRDAYRNRSASLHGGYTFGAGTRLDATLLEARGRVQYDGSFANEARFLQRTVGVALSQPLAAGWTLRAQLGHARDDSENFLGADSQGRFDTRRDSGSLLLDGRVAEHWSLSGGVDVLRDSVDATEAYDEDARRSSGVFTQARYTRGAWDALASLRRDDNQQFGGHTTGSLAVGFSFAPRWRWTLSGGTGFKAPTFNELYFPGFGNAALGPETATSIESSLRYTRGVARATLTAFQNRIDDLIGFDSNFQPVNIDRTRTRGLEFEWAARLAAWDVAVSGQLLEPLNLGAGELRGKWLPRRARQQAHLEFGREFGALRLGAVVEFSGARFDDLSNQTRLGGYGLLDLLAEWRVNDALRLQARLANAFDRDYASAAYYPQAGRQAFVTLRYAPRH